MKYPDTLKIHLINPKKKVAPATIVRLKKFFLSFNDIVITHSYRAGSGIEYSLVDVEKWASGRVVVTLARKDED